MNRSSQEYNLVSNEQCLLKEKEKKRKNIPKSSQHNTQITRGSVTSGEQFQDANVFERNLFYEKKLNHVYNDEN
ncbi:hypothetical protein evm_010750 [Chilo suppressalis]|nr:hypothetical protein evm_010750 [Chilo suppressalis]